MENNHNSYNKRNQLYYLNYNENNEFNYDFSNIKIVNKRTNNRKEFL